MTRPAPARSRLFSWLSTREPGEWFTTEAAHSGADISTSGAMLLLREMARAGRLRVQATRPRLYSVPVGSLRAGSWENLPRLAAELRRNFGGVDLDPDAIQAWADECDVPRDFGRIAAHLVEEGAEMQPHGSVRMPERPDPPVILPVVIYWTDKGARTP